MNNASWYARKLQQKSPSPAPRPTSPNVILPSERPMQTFPTQPAPPRETTCPECGSGNFLMKGTPRCFDCGHIQGRDVQNSTKGMIADGPVKKAVQVESSGYQPGTIIGRVG